ncbi:MAG: DNA polymerase/3'-5' exonuclease PolX [Deltaproteobacteria bacterium]|nr:DNA polymerase/3'-5' exonuclease PolX [Deltaproteobacteria bacterium]
MDRKLLSRLLEETAFYLELTGANQFKARAYSSAARTILKADLSEEELADTKKLKTLKGIGPSLAESIAEAVTTGRLKTLEELKASLPAGIGDLARIPGLGAKKIRRLHQELGIASLGELAYAINENRLTTLPGFGPKSQANILKNLEFIKRQQDRFLLPEAWQVARDLEEFLTKSEAVLDLRPAGEMRRMMDTVARVEMVAASKAPGAVLTHFSSWVKGTQLARPQPNQAGFRHPSGLWVQIEVVSPQLLGSALVWATGSDQHLDQLQNLAQEQGLEFKAEGLFKSSRPLELADEETFYQALGLDFIPPELRQGWGEIEAAAEGRLPRLVQAEDIKGLFHVHTKASDGAYSLLEMAQRAKNMGFTYLGLADHSQSAFYAGGLKAEGLRAQAREVDRVNKTLAPFKVFHGVESDILTDGGLDYPDQVLDRLDFVIASVHGNFKLDQARQTERIIKAVSHKATTILGHPTGRLLLAREAYQLDLEAVVRACAETGVALEINANPQRLDIDWRTARQAQEEGVRFALGPDAHSLQGLSDTQWGLAVARKAWLTKKDLLNCLSAGELSDYLHQQKAKN